MKTARKLSKRVIALIVCACFVLALLLLAAGLQIFFVLADRVELWRPDYDMLSEDEMKAILSKDGLTDEDYEVLYAQTGLTKIGIDRALDMDGSNGIRRILEIQSCYFADYDVINDRFIMNGMKVPYICTDRLDGAAEAIYLAKGDIIVTSSTHISGYRMGHSGIAVGGNDVMQAMAYGTPSYVGTIGDFTSRINFMIFTVRCDEETKSSVADYALANLIGIPYNALTGVFTNKNKIKYTQCAHLVWYAYKQFGIDLDSDGGLVVTPRDLARSPKLELVQVFGFDPNALW